MGDSSKRLGVEWSARGLFITVRCNPTGDYIVGALDIIQRGVPGDAKELGRINRWISAS